MNEFAAAFQFFEDFGGNWFALRDCLIYLDDRFDADSYIVVITHPEDLLIDDLGEELEWFIQTLEEVGEWWSRPISDNHPYNRAAIPFHAVLQVQRGEFDALDPRLRSLPRLRQERQSNRQGIRCDPKAPSAIPGVPSFVACPEGSPVYHGFEIVPETETDGWVYGAISDYESGPQTEGDGFVVAPDGARAGIVWATDAPHFYEISPPDDERWGVYGIRFPRPVSSVDDLVFNFRAVLPRLKERFAELRKG